MGFVIFIFDCLQRILGIFEGIFVYVCRVIIEDLPISADVKISVLSRYVVDIYIFFNGTHMGQVIYDKTGESCCFIPNISVKSSKEDIRETLLK